MGEPITPIIRTISGKLINLLDPDPAQITIGDIAHGLSLVNRFGGHTPEPYSVGEHSILVASHFHVPAEYRAALMHDAAEAYLGDMVGPLKYSLIGGLYRELEERWENVLAERFNFATNDHSLKAAIKDVDKMQFEWERTFVVNNPCRVAPRPADVKFQFANLARTRGEIRG